MDSAIAIGLMVLKVTCVLLIALLATLAMQRASAGSRHLVWLTALGALLVVPALAVWQPLKVLPVGGTAVGEAAAGTKAVDEAAAGTKAVDEAAVDHAAVDGAPVAATAAGAAAERRGWDAATVLRLVIAVWAGVAILLLGWLAWGAWQVRRIVRRAKPLDDPAWQGPLYEIADRFGLEDAPRLVQSDDVKMPFAAGLAHPAIVLPTSSAEWNVERRSAVLIHELAHVKRRDLVGHTMGRIACAIYWFHPMVWSAARHLRNESERACDDLALTFGTRPSEYAEHLLDIVTCVRDHATPSVAIAMAHRKEFEGRMLAILNPDLTRRGMGRLRTAGVVGTLALVALAVGAAGPATRMAVDEPSAPAAAALPTDEPASVPIAVEAPARPDAQRTTRKQVSQTTRAMVEKESTRTDTVTMAEAAKRAMTDPALARKLDSINTAKVRVLAKVLRSDSDPSVRRTAAWGLQDYVRSDSAVAALVAAVNSDTDAGVREMSVWALADARATPAVRQALAKAARDSDADVQRTAIWALGSVEDEASIDIMTAALKSSDPEVRSTAAWAIGSTEPDQAPPALIAALQDGDADVRRTAIWALFNIEDPAALKPLEAAFAKETNPELRRDIVRAMGAMGDAATDALSRLVTSSDKEIRDAAVGALAGGGASGPWPQPRPRPRPMP